MTDKQTEIVYSIEIVDNYSPTHYSFRRYANHDFENTARQLLFTLLMPRAMTFLTQYSQGP